MQFSFLLFFVVVWYCSNLLIQSYNQYWNGNVIILKKFLSLAELEVVKMTTSSAANDKNFIILLQWVSVNYPLKQWTNKPINQSRNVNRAKQTNAEQIRVYVLWDVLYIPGPCAHSMAMTCITPFPSVSAIFIILSTIVDLLVQAMLIPCRSITCHYRSQMGFWHW